MFDGEKCVARSHKKDLNGGGPSKGNCTLLIGRVADDVCRAFFKSHQSGASGQLSITARPEKLT